MKDVLSKIKDGDYDNPVKELSPRGEMERYREEQKKLVDMFKADLEKEFELKDHLKKDLLWDIAWSNGHINGLSEVFACYEEMSDLLK